MNKLHVLREFATVRWLRRFSDRVALQQYQQKMIRRQLEFLRQHSPYFANITFEKLEDLPYMDKQVMMENFNALNTVGIDRDQALRLAIDSEKSREFDEKLNGISVGLSSGTSGHRGLFVISDYEIEQWAGTVLAKMLPKNKIYGNRIAFFLRADNNLYEGTKSKAVDFRYFDILKDMNEHVRALNDYQPTLLVAPPSVFLVLSQFVEAGQLHIQPLKVISVAEVLTHEDEERFKRIFHQERIHQVYQCTEGFLGYTCECGSFHINEDVVYVEKEYIDEKRFVPIITDFVRSSQPVIRYRLNDILVESNKPCPCGSPCMVIEKIEGREDDIFVFEAANPRSIEASNHRIIDPSNNRSLDPSKSRSIDPSIHRFAAPQEVLVFPDFISRCLVYVEGIHDYRVCQTSKDQITVYLDNLDDEVKRQVISEFERLSTKMHFICPSISFEPYQRDLTRKMKRVEKTF